MEEIEQKAMNDYRKKDLGSNSDITAQIFNAKRAERDASREQDESERARNAAQMAALEASMEPQAPGPSVAAIGPQIETAKPLFRKIEAPTSGTKWHNAPGTKKWHEAQSDEGHTYYWNTETNESSWEVPAAGFLSIKEQREQQNASSFDALNPVSESLQEQRDAKDAHQKFIQEKLKKVIDPKKKFKSSTEQSYLKPKKADKPTYKPVEHTTFQGPSEAAQPYGKWTVVEKPAEWAPVDYQVPQVQAGPTANVTLHSDRLTKFVEKSTPSLGGTSSSGGMSSKPAIVFRKRKINDEQKKNVRRREDD